MYKTGTKHHAAPFLGALVMACGAAPAATAADQPQTASNQAPTAPDQPGTSKALDEIVVTGTAEAKGVRKQDAPCAITTANDVQIRESVPYTRYGMAEPITCSK
jgi:iron complex outermembrane recepter protein